MPFRTRLFATVAVIIVAGLVDATIAPVAVIGSAQMAGRQFDNSDAGAIGATIGMDLFHGLGGLVTLLTLAALALLWWKPLLRGRSLLVLLAAAGLANAGPARAYYNKTDIAEAYTIMPNESAFWIPDIGANKDTQVEYDSEAYYQANRIPLKRFLIPHAILPHSTGWISMYDYYVPTGRLIVVDRAPYVRHWAHAATRGTSVNDEGIECQTKEGINLTTSITIGASVPESSAARFLFNFGVNNPTGDRTDPNVIFTSVYYGRSLTQVMDGIGFGAIHSAVCAEFGSRSLDEANAAINTIMASVERTAKDFLGARGIRIDYIGWGGTWTFDAPVQTAINEKYAADTIAPVIALLERKAAVDALEGWDHRLPTSVSLSSWGGFADMLGSLLAGLKK